MKQLILLLMVLLMTSFTSVDLQTKFEKGFNSGYESGWCYQQPNCIAPSPPSAPTPNVNESSDSYKDGYNRGFTKGKSDKRKQIINNAKATIMSLKEQVEEIEKTISSGVVHPDNPFHFEITSRYNELKKQLSWN